MQQIFHTYPRRFFVCLFAVFLLLRPKQKQKRHSKILKFGPQNSVPPQQDFIRMISRPERPRTQYHNCCRERPFPPGRRRFAPRYPRYSSFRVEAMSSHQIIISNRAVLVLRWPFRPTGKNEPWYDTKSAQQSVAVFLWRFAVWSAEFNFPISRIQKSPKKYCSGLWFGQFRGARTPNDRF